MKTFETNLVGCSVKFPVRSLDLLDDGVEEETGRVVGVTMNDCGLILLIAVHGSGEIIKKVANHVRLFGGVFD